MKRIPLHSTPPTRALHRAALTLALLTGVTPLLGLAPAGRAQTIVQNFAGLSLTETSAANGFRYAPPDTMGAVGPTAFIEFINGGYAVYDKTTATRLTFTTDTAFWTAAGISPTLTGQGLSDTRIKYDPLSARWFASEITLGSGGVNNSVLLAVSKTSNPLDGFLGTSYTAVSSTRFGDYPTLAVDANAVYIGTNNFSTTGFTGVTTTSIPKSSLTAATPTTAGRVTSTQASTTPSRGFTPQGVNNTAAGTTSGAFLAVSATSFNQAKLTPVNTPAGTATFGAPVTVTGLFDGNTTFARQPDGTRAIDALDDRISSSVVQVGSRIFAVNAINNGNTGTTGTEPGFDSVHWFVLNAGTGALLAQGLINDGAHDFFQPSIAVNDNGDMVIGYNRSGANGIADRLSSYASVGHIDGSNNVSFGDPILLKLGEVDNYTDGFGSTTSRWGDYSATTLDPSDPTMFWTIQEVPLANGDWGTQITSLQVVPEPASITLAVLGAAGLAVAASRRRPAAVV